MKSIYNMVKNYNKKIDVMNNQLTRLATTVDYLQANEDAHKQEILELKALIKSKLKLNFRMNSIGKNL